MKYWLCPRLTDRRKDMVIRICFELPFAKMKKAWENI